jgi:hypothetical protein
MSQSKNNIVTEGLSGKVYQLVFRQWFGKTIVAKRPRTFSTNSASQLSIRDSFKKAAVYAKAAITDAATRLAYKAKAKPGQSAYNMAFADFFKPPSIGDIDTSTYSSQAGSTINIEATDDFKVVSVKVKIEKANGTLVEQGSATLSSDGLHWLYTVTASGNITGNVISVTATDLPGNAIVKQITI